MAESALNSNQLRILRTLAASEFPLKSSELMRRTGMFNNEMQKACAGLLSAKYIDRQLKRLKQQIGDSRALKTLAFWSLTKEGHEALQSAPNIADA